MTPIRQSDLPPLVRSVADVVWHGVTVMLVLMAGGLAWLAFAPNPALLWMICAVQIGFALGAVGFALLGLAGLLATRRFSRRSSR